MVQPSLKNMQKKMSTKTLGFTLIELLITVAIIGILASVAYPSYTDFVLRSNRSEGQRELMRLANLQEQVFVDTRSYASNMKGLGMSTDEYTTESGNYLISVVAGATATTFTLQAVAKKSQVKDTDCTTLKVDYLGAKTPKECWE
jgi:type IV pilus assembly protein PilE